ncbi:MAG: dual specificity protein phosphatase [Anaerolineales bacterium]
MDEIRPWLYIGKYRDTLDKHQLDTESIQAMLQMAEPVKQDGINSLYLSIEDMAPIPPHLIKQGVDFIIEEKQNAHKILVACGAGINRSTAFCIAALKETEGLDLKSAYQEIKKKHPEALPHEPIWLSLCKYYNETVPYLDIMRLSLQ